VATIHLDGMFGTPREAVDADFPYFGQRIRIHPDATDLFEVDIMAKAQAIELGDIDLSDPTTWTAEQAKAMQDGMTVALDAVKGQIHPDDWDRFLTVARANRQQTMDLMELSQKLTAEVAGFPTGQSTDSSTTPPRTGRKSRSNSSGRGRSAGPSVADSRKALRLLDGRPDLQMAVVRAAEAG
jgi:hypothetical protein